MNRLVAMNSEIHAKAARKFAKPNSLFHHGDAERKDV